MRLWDLEYVDIASKEARRFLDERQFAHAVDLCTQLAREPIPGNADLVDVERIEDFFELRDKGGVLGKINLRIYFAVLDSDKTIVILGCWKKEAEGKVPHHKIVCMRSRLRFVKSVKQKKGKA